MKHFILGRDVDRMKVKVVSNQQELDDAFSIRHEVFVHEQNVPIELEIDEYENTATHFVLYDEDGNPCGAGRCRETDDAVKVERICVLKDYRKNGAGKLIMNAIEELAKQQNYKKLKLNAQTHAEGFYQKLGYQTMSEEFMDAGIPHITMVKDIL